jgi:hypothetical protein
MGGTPNHANEHQEKDSFAKPFMPTISSNSAWTQRHIVSHDSN